MQKISNYKISPEEIIGTVPYTQKLLPNSFHCLYLRVSFHSSKTILSTYLKVTFFLCIYCTYVQKTSPYWHLEFLFNFQKHCETCKNVWFIMIKATCIAIFIWHCHPLTEKLVNWGSSLVNLLTEFSSGVGSINIRY